MRLKPKFKGTLLTLIGIAFVLAGLWTYTGIRLGIWSYNEYERYNWLTANLPVAHELWYENIKAGDNVDQLISKWQPHLVRNYMSWVEMRWYPGGRQTNSLSLIGIAVVAKDGVLVRADSYSDDLVCARTFFNSLTPQAEAEHRAAFEAYVDSLRAHQQQNAAPPK